MEGGPDRSGDWEVVRVSVSHNTYSILPTSETFKEFQENEVSLRSQRFKLGESADKDICVCAVNDLHKVTCEAQTYNK